MTISIGQVVACPPDRGTHAYTGKVVHIGDRIEANIHGIKFRWLTIQRTSDGTKAVWPSHRLGLGV